MKKLYLAFYVVTTLLCGGIHSQDRKLTEAEKEVIVKESGIKLKGKELQKYFSEIEADVNRRSKLSLSDYLSTRKRLEQPEKSGLRAGMARFAGCEQYTFDDPQSPLVGWRLSFNTNPFSFSDPIDEGVLDIQYPGLRFLEDGAMYRFEVFPETYNDPYIDEPDPAFGVGSYVRIGNPYRYTRKEMVSRSFVLNNQTDFIYYNYAIALEDPDHDQRPYFSIRLLFDGVEIPCSRIDYEAIPSIPGFHDHDTSPSVKIKDWASNVIKPADFGAQIGETVTVEVEVSDCGWGGHFGYGMFDIRCLSENDIIALQGNTSSQVCTGSTINISTPLVESVTNYTWEIVNPNGVPVLLPYPNAQSFDFNFLMPGLYIVKLSVPYFTTTSHCSNESVFTREVLVAPCGDCIDCSSFNPIKKKKYLVCGWLRQQDPGNLERQFTAYTSGYLRIEFTDIANNLISTHNFLPTGPVIDGWQRILGEVTIPENVEDFHLDLVNGDESLNSFFDDVRMLPSDANMKSYVYDKATQRLMAELDENNFSTFYEYDKEGGLIRIKKETEKGVFTIQETRSNTVKISEP